MGKVGPYWVETPTDGMSQVKDHDRSVCGAASASTVIALQRGMFCMARADNRIVWLQTPHSAQYSLKSFSNR